MSVKDDKLSMTDEERQDEEAVYCGRILKSLEPWKG